MTKKKGAFWKFCSKSQNAPSFQLTYYIKADIIINNAGNCEKLNNIRSKIMKKFIALLIAVIMVVGVVGLVGCKGGDNETTTTTTTESTKQTTTTTTEATTTTTTTTTTETTTTAETTTAMVTTTLPMYTRFDFGTASKAVDEKKTSHEWLVENVSYNKDFLDIEFLEDSWKISSKKAYASDAAATSWTISFDAMLSLDFEDVLMPAWGTWKEYPHNTAKVGVEGQWQGYHQYVKIRLRSNSVNNMIGFSWQTGTNPYATTMTVSNMYLDGGIDNKTRTANENWFTETYDISLCQALASNKAGSDTAGNAMGRDTKFSYYLEQVKQGKYNAGNNWNWQQGKEITGLRFNLLGAVSSGACDSRENIKAGDWVEIDYIVFGSTPEQLETYKSKSELAA